MKIQLKKSFSGVTLSCLFLGVTALNMGLARAETIEFADEELAQESVLPVFDKTEVVRERAIKTAGRFEIGAGSGLNLVEPLYEQLLFNLTASYHFTELHGVNVIAYMMSTGLSNAGNDLKDGKGLKQKFDASRAPVVENMIFANYQFTAYYGKINITKQNTMNLSLYGFFGAGMVQWSDKSQFGLDAGIGQKIYFTQNLAARADLNVTLYQGPDPTSPKTTGSLLNPTDPIYDSAQFESTYYIRPMLSLALIYMF